MLVLTRRINESINIGQNIEIFIVEIKDDHVKIGIRAPKDIPIYRQEIYKSILEENELAASAPKTALQDMDKLFTKNFPEKV